MMSHPKPDWSATSSLRPFIGSRDFAESRTFYQVLGFEEIALGSKLSLFKVNEQFSFYLQDYYVKEWMENSMIFLVVDDLSLRLSQVEALNLTVRFPLAKVSSIRQEDWGRVFYIHDPSGVLWHVAEF